MSELSQQARELLDATRECDDPSALDRARVRRRVQIALAAAAGGATAAAAAPAVATQAGAAGAGAQLAAAAQAVVGASVSAKVGVAVTVAVIGVASSSAVVLHEPVAPAREAKRAPAARAERPERAARAKLPTTQVALPEAPLAEVAPASDPVAPPVVARPVAVEPKPRSARVKAPPAAPAAPLAPSLEGELELLAAAQAALREGDDAGALALLDAHAARFPDGMLALERDAARIVALCNAGRLAEGRARRAARAQELARSPLAARIDKACER